MRLHHVKIACTEHRDRGVGLISSVSAAQKRNSTMLLIIDAKWRVPPLLGRSQTALHIVPRMPQALRLEISVFARLQMGLMFVSAHRFLLQPQYHRLRTFLASLSSE